MSILSLENEVIFLYDNFDGIVIPFGDFNLEIHTSILVWLTLCLVIGIVLVIAGNKFKKADISKAPSGMVLVFEQAINLILFIVENSLGKNTRKYSNLISKCQNCKKMKDEEKMS